jgi:Fibronectin type III domain
MMSGSVDPFSPAFSVAFGSAGWTSLTPTAALSLTITGLKAGATYDIQVYAVNASGSGPPSPVLTITT